eukprot:CAMPEP_0198555494 /NCGR_PEP_ID=MMETSP1462-20131121/84830_1 /TAXON_ID=1333877 /ORGANISM="Brandtodinium nutriculum, Strain RCC3387" /LENGTH=289 /DNA_ID=CAMNT_0044286223 /DNA_START=71 /DNA_END=937 /DNA_ORIENTATION=-
MRELLSLAPEAALLVGDLSYADGWAPIWDRFGTMMEPLMATVGHLTVVGNHDISEGFTQAVDWMSRYPTPWQASNSTTPLQYTYEMGLMYVIGLPGSYAPTGSDSAQYQFLEEALARVNRTRTPWVVVQFHTPWYNSCDHHYEEGYKARVDQEALLYSYGVDLAFNGHVHSYERTHPVFKYQVDECGIRHIVIGDAGNYEGPALPWRDPQPAWSAFREASYGGGLLTIHNATHAEFEWRRVACVTSQDSSTEEGYTVYVWEGLGAPGNGNCSSSADNSAQRFEAVDRVE